MITTIVTFFLIICLVADALLLHMTIVNCRSEKKNYFVLGLFCIFLFVLGNFVEIVSKSTDCALIGSKIMYIGASFLPTFFLFFVANYCEQKLTRYERLFKGCMYFLSFLNLFLVWTTDRFYLFYRSWSFTEKATLPGLLVEELGPFYYYFYVFSILCVILSSLILIHSMRRWSKSHRLSLLLLIVTAAVPLLANGLYILSTYVLKFNLHGVNLTPFALVLTNVFIYLSILRYDLFDFAPQARSATLDMVRDAVIFLNDKMDFIAANKIAYSLFPDLENIGKGGPIGDLKAWPPELQELESLAEHRDIRFSMETDGAPMQVYNAWVNPLCSGKRVMGIVVLIQNITDHVTLMQQLEEAAYSDGLTGLYNRRHFLHLVKMQMEKAKRDKNTCSFIMFDLDLFKSVNDTWGHLAGDEVLRRVADRVRRTLRTYDIVARYGGEEFVVCMTDTPLKIALKLAERLRIAIEEMTIYYEGIEIRITISLGVAEADSAGTIDEILQRADNALYRAKETGRNRVCAAENRESVTVQTR